jgi:hypothetical protein
LLFNGSYVSSEWARSGQADPDCGHCDYQSGGG